MNAQPPIAGVVVTFHPDADFERRLEAVAREANPLIVIDNTAEPAVQDRLARACGARGAQLIANEENRGLARALNQAFAAHAHHGIEWVIAFDQDSTPEPGFSRALFATATGDAAVTGANWRDEARPNRSAKHLRAHPVPGSFRRTVAQHDLTDVTCVITSGSLFHVPTWRELGGFDDGLFLDLVDSDYCLRARAAGYEVRVSAEARLQHRRGAKRAVSFAGRNWWPAFMPPSRLHLLFRNRVLLFRRHAIRTPHWAVFELAYAMKILLEIVLLENEKTAKFVACARGTWDGLRGRTGGIRM